MTLRWPAPLRAGDLIGVTAPSAGVATEFEPRLAFAFETLLRDGFAVQLGECMGADSYVSAPAVARAAEVQRMLCDPQVRAVVPPWGGELGIDILRLLDWDAIASAEPTWVVGYSDTSTLLMSLTIRCGWATVHAGNLMDTPYRVPDPLLSWIDVVGLPRGSSVTQGASIAHRGPGFDDWTVDPHLTEHPLNITGSWTRLDREGDVDVTGVLIGGCIEAVSNLTGTPFGDVPAFGRRHCDEGLLVYLEASELGAYDIGRRLHGMRLAGWFDDARAVLLGRTYAPDEVNLTQHDVYRDVFGDMGIPVIADVDCGHVPPPLALVNGAPARVVMSGAGQTVTMTV